MQWGGFQGDHSPLACRQCPCFTVTIDGETRRVFLDRSPARVEHETVPLHALELLQELVALVVVFFWRDEVLLSQGFEFRELLF